MVNSEVLIHDVVYTIILALSIIFLIVTCTTEPGIIPRKSKNHQLDNLPPIYKDIKNQVEK